LERVFVSWSGGKDGCLALHRAKAGGMDVCYLANTVDEDGRRSRSHGISSAVIRRQAEALGIPVFQQPTGQDDYEEKFVGMLKYFKSRGIGGGVFGDIDFTDHREWNERVCASAGMIPYLPLWQEDQRRLVGEFIDAGYVAVVVTVKASILGKEFLGRRLDRKLLADIAGLGRGITPCGEAGEFHTLVIDGPLFNQRLEITKSEKVTHGEHHFLEIMATELKDKEAAEHAT
jgi:diphthine-ammonia ligase